MARPAGTLNSKTLQAIGILNEKGCNPLGILADIAMGTPLEGLDTIPTLDHRKDAAKELCQYIYPKRKAVEHSGEDGAAILIERIERHIIDANAKNTDS